MRGLPFTPETSVEVRICNDPAWLEGIVWGKPRRAHPEGKVIDHIVEVLSNIDKLDASKEERANLRLIALVHDTFKYKVPPHWLGVKDHGHGEFARRFAQLYIQDDGILDIIELHDEAHNSWVAGERYGDWDSAMERARDLISTLGGNVGLYLKFYECDNRTGSKKQGDIEWFKELIGAHL
jgi:hypothetical protein